MKNRIGRNKERRCIKNVEEECTCHPCAAHPQAICSTTSRALHWLACHYTLHMVFDCVFILIHYNICLCPFIFLNDCHVLMCDCVYPKILAIVCLYLLMTDCVSPVCTYGTCLAIITLVHWGFQLNASGRWGEGLSGITRVTDQQGVPLGLHPDYD